MSLTSSNPTGKIAYVLKGFPRLSESFIANEVRLLTSLGLNLHPFSVKGGDELAERDELPPITYLPAVTSMSEVSMKEWLSANWSNFSPTQRYWIHHDPLAYGVTLAFALKCAWQYRRGSSLKKTFIKEFLFATEIARQMKQEGGFVHIHAHFCHDATTIAWMVSKLIKLPFSFTAHAKDIYQGSLNPGDLLERKLTVAQFVTTCTMANVSYLTNRARYPDRIHGIYHGLNTRRFRPSADFAPHHAGPIRLLSVGRHVEKKGFSFLIQACQLLSERGLGFELRIVGEKGDQTEQLTDEIERLGLQDSVVLSEPVAQNQLTDIYHWADIFVLPCVVVADGDRDGIPNVMAEAMACGLPVVVSAISGIPEIVENDQNGLHVQQRNPREIAQAIWRLSEDSQLRARLGTNARQTIETRFDATTTHIRLRDLFLATLSERHGQI